MAMQRGKDSLAPAVLAYEDTLDPPENPVPPVAPLIRDHELPDHLAIHLGNPIPAFAGILENRVNSRVDELQGKRAPFSLHRHLHVELDNRGRVGRTRVEIGRASCREREQGSVASGAFAYE